MINRHNTIDARFSASTKGCSLLRGVGLALLPRTRKTFLSPLFVALVLRCERPDPSSGLELEQLRLQQLTTPVGTTMVESRPPLRAG
jgi:hypothetical protein